MRDRWVLISFALLGGWVENWVAGWRTERAGWLGVEL